MQYFDRDENAAFQKLFKQLYIVKKGRLFSKVGSISLEYGIAFFSLETSKYG